MKLRLKFHQTWIVVVGWSTGLKQKPSSQGRETEMTIVIVSTEADRRCARKLNFRMLAEIGRWTDASAEEVPGDRLVPGTCRRDLGSAFVDVFLDDASSVDMQFGVLG